jgi:hypothetical protein
METRESHDYDKHQWQAEQSARDAAWDKQREREAKARERSAANAKRKIARLKDKLKELGKLTEWEEEFSESVTERLDEFGSAFADLQKGRPGDALSFAQKRVVASLNKKVKDVRKAAKAERLGEEKTEEEEKPAYKPRSSFKSKKPKFTPRVRNIEDDFEDEADGPPPRQPFIPRYVADSEPSPQTKSNTPARPQAVTMNPPPATKPLAQKKTYDESVDDDTNRPPVGRPFLRVISSD